MGYAAASVAPCQKMMNVLLPMAAPTGAGIQSCVRRMEGFQGQRKFSKAPFFERIVDRISVCSL
jgi:hypothetical protein